jgi:hypothetical protein
MRSCLQTGMKQPAVYILTPIRLSSDQIGDSARAIHQLYRNHEKVNKSKGPNIGPGL